MSVDQRSQLRVHIRWMIRRDMPEVLDIERASFEFPWFEEDFIRCLRQRNCIGMVAEHAEHVVGFMIYELHKTRLHILNFAVAAQLRRRGIGVQMVEKLVGKLSSQRRTEISLEVRETNLAAQIFFRENGFRAIDVLRDFYDDSPEDAYVMRYSFQEDQRSMILPLNRIDRLAG
jgi:[ribosomal protein S18]-alanine N-acetyltransferase